MAANFQIETDKILNTLKGKPRLLLHACCAPCSSYVLEYLMQHFNITMLFFNPNITDKHEYEKRLDEIYKLLNLMPEGGTINLLPHKYENQSFYKAAKGLENEPEGGKRCENCFLLRLSSTGRAAKENGFDFFATTLTVSPHKNARIINETGFRVQEAHTAKYLPSDFKKREGYKRSIELSQKYGLYRQDFCGCEFSKT